VLQSERGAVFGVVFAIVSDATVATLVWPWGRIVDILSNCGYCYQLFPNILSLMPTNSSDSSVSSASSVLRDPNSSASVALPLDKELVLKVIPMPGDCNANGDIFGGWVMAQVDLAGSVIPARHTQGRMATVAVNEFIFKQPVRVGDILSFFSEVTRLGRTSVTVKVEVYAERFRSQGKYIKVTEALVTYVAIDDQGRPREIAK
jgi:acyl-CoA thioesterase YciA